jgi:Penicillin amidase
MVTTPDVQNDRQRDLQAALPDMSNTLYLDGLDGEIDIYRDRYGIPHIRASSTRDAFFGQRLATAQDRLWHEDMRAIHAERVSIPAQVYMRWVAEIEPQDALSALAKERFSAWGLLDGRRRGCPSDLQRLSWTADAADDSSSTGGCVGRRNVSGHGSWRSGAHAAFGDADHDNGSER